MLHIKGGAVAYKNKAFLFLGRGGSGKTEIIKELCNNGAKFMANTHLIVNDNAVFGIKSNIRFRKSNNDVYLSFNELYKNNTYNDWLSIGGIFWVDYRTDGLNLIKKIQKRYIIDNMRFFSEAIINWEMKEDLADYYNSDPILFSKHIKKTDKILKNFVIIMMWLF